MSVQRLIRPFNPDTADTLARSQAMDWIQTDEDGKAFIKVLWTNAETGHWAVIFRWLKGFVAPAHKHLSASHTFILSGRLQVRDCILEAGDYVYEPNGIIHGATTALEDTEYFFIGEGALLFYDNDRFTHFVGWEQMARTGLQHRQPKS